MTSTTHQPPWMCINSLLYNNLCGCSENKRKVAKEIKWSDHAVQRKLIALYRGGSSYREIAQYFDRGEKTIVYHIHLLVKQGSITLRHPKKLSVKRVLWTAEEDEILRKNYPADCTGLLSRSKEAIRRHVLVLKL